MLHKPQIIQTLETLDEEFSIDELFERLSLIEKVEEGLKDSQNGNKISQEEMQKEIQGWFK